MKAVEKEPSFLVFLGVGIFGVSAEWSRLAGDLFSWEVRGKDAKVPPKHGSFPILD